MGKVKNKSSLLAERTIDLKKYILSDKVSLDSKEFIPLQAAITILSTTNQTIKQRIENGELKEKTFFIIDPVKKTFTGLEIGGVKKLLLFKKDCSDKISQHVKESALIQKKTSYADTLDAAGMNWRSPPDRKFINKVLQELSHTSYENTVDSGHPCLISAVVVSRSENIPTQSFFDDAIALGLLDYDSSQMEKVEFWEEQLKLVYAKYGNTNVTK